jgi:hypothetical protein
LHEALATSVAVLSCYLTRRHRSEISDKDFVVPILPGSPPFSLSAADWRKIIIGGVISMLGALATYIGVEVLPTLKEHVATDSGLLIYTAIAAIAPVLLNIGRKWFGDTRIIGMLVAVGLCLGMANPAMAQEFQGATAAVINGSFLTTIMADPLMSAGILIVVCLVLSKVLKIDVTPFLAPIFNTLLKPPSTTPVVVPTTPVVTPTIPATPATPLAPVIAPALQILLDLLLKARSAGDKEGEQAALKLLDQLRV